MLGIVLISFFAYYVYYGSIAILGTSVPDYVFWIGFAVVGCILFVFKGLVKTHAILDLESFILIVFSILVIILFTINGEMNPIMIIQRNLFVLWSFPSLLIGITVKKEKLQNIWKIEILSVFLFVGLVIEFFATRSLGRPVFGGTTYQNYSYAALYVFTLELFALFWNPKKEKINRLAKTILQVFRYVMVFASVIFMAFGGGRGAFGTAVVVVLLTLFLKDHEQGSYKKSFRFLAVLALILIGYVVVANVTYLSNRFERIFNFFGKGFLDWENSSSGRDVIYENVYTLFESEPVWGYGFLNGVKLLGRYAHNIFFDIILEGGILYLGIWILLLVNVVKNIISSCRDGDQNYIWLYLFVLCLGRLMFSGMYWSDGGIWLLVGMFFKIKLKKE